MSATDTSSAQYAAQKDAEAQVVTMQETAACLRSSWRASLRHPKILSALEKDRNLKSVSAHQAHKMLLVTTKASIALTNSSIKDPTGVTKECEVDLPNDEGSYSMLAGESYYCGARRLHDDVYDYAAELRKDCEPGSKAFDLRDYWPECTCESKTARSSVTAREEMSVGSTLVPATKSPTARRQ